MKHEFVIKSLIVPTQMVLGPVQLFSWLISPKITTLYIKDADKSQLCYHCKFIQLNKHHKDLSNNNSQQTEPKST